MSVRALGAAWRVECEPPQKLLLLALADHANDETFDCWPSLTHLSEKTGLGRSTIARALSALEAAGLIVREQREKQSTRYVLKVSRWCQSGTSARAGLVPERDGGSAGEGLGSPTAGPSLVPQRDHNHQSNHQRTEEHTSEVPSDPPEGRVKVPVAQIVAAYHEILPMCPAVKKLTTARESHIRSRWRSGDLPDINTWREYFRYVSESRFLTGRASPMPGRKVFVADLEWLAKEGNYAKVYEGKYHREGA